MLRALEISNLARCLVFGGLVVLCGCSKKGPEPPQTFPVTGEVHYVGGEPIAKGLIQFQSEKDPALNVSGVIVDGKFSVVTSFGNRSVPGTIAGTYWVSVTPEFKLEPKTVRLTEIYEVRSEPTQFQISVPPPK
jgi:hypothetical protein